LRRNLLNNGYRELAVTGETRLSRLPICPAAQDLSIAS